MLVSIASGPICVVESISSCTLKTLLGVTSIVSYGMTCEALGDTAGLTGVGGVVKVCVHKGITLGAGVTGRVADCITCLAVEVGGAGGCRVNALL